MNQEPIVEKKIIHVNKQFGDLQTNLKSSISYNLKDPIKLRKGDTVQLLKAMIGQRGLAADTISFDKDQEISVTGFLTIPANKRKLGKFGKDDTLQVEFKTTPAKISDNKPSPPGFDINVYDEDRNGPTNTPVILYKIDRVSFEMTPVKCEKTVKIQAGNYTVQTLANEFTQQMNGQIVDGNNFADFVTKIEDQQKSFGGNYFDNQWIFGIPTYSVGSDSTDLSAFQQAITKKGTIDGYAFVSLDAHQHIINKGKIDGVRVKPVDLTTAGIKPVFYYPNFLINQKQDPDADPPEYTTGFCKQFIIGASEFQLTFDSQSLDRYSYTNFHTPAKLKNFSDNKTPNSNAGQQITTINYISKDDAPSLPGFYPYMHSSGVFVTSFQKELYYDTDEYKRLSALYNANPNSVEGIKAYFTLLSNTTDQYFPNGVIPDSTWLNCFWDRLGFDVNQLGNIQKNIRTVNSWNANYKLPGLITYNDSSYSQATGSSGLGEGIVTQNGLNLQTYDCVGPFEGGSGEDGAFYQEFSLLCNSKYVSANKFPDLTGGKNYYIVESDIVQNNYFDVTSNEKNIIGVLNFELSSNDTIYENQFEPFPVSQDRVLTQINIDLKNPDGTPVFEDILNENSGFFFLITRNVTQEMIQQEQENKEIQKTKK